MTSSPLTAHSARLTHTRHDRAVLLGHRLKTAALDLVEHRLHFRRRQTLGKRNLAIAKRDRLSACGSGRLTRRSRGWTRTGPGLQLLANDRHVQPEHLGGRRDIAVRAEGRVRNREDSLGRAQVNLDFATHARAEKSFPVADSHEHGKHHYVLLLESLRLDLEHAPGEVASRKGVHRDRDRKAG